MTQNEQGKALTALHELIQLVRSGEFYNDHDESAAVLRRAEEGFACLTALVLRRQTCTIDLATVSKVSVGDKEQHVNEALVDGWVLLDAGIDANGFPLFILGWQP